MQNKLMIPGAIVIAGALIAGAVVLSGKNTSPSTATVKTTHPEIVLSAVTSADHILGSADADIVMVEFSDLECPFCKQFQATGHKLLEKYGKDNQFAWVYRHYPIPELHSKAVKESEASECAADQGGNEAFWKYIDRIYEITPANNKLDAAELPKIAKEIGLDVAKFNECLSSGKFTAKVTEDAKQASKAGGNGTPYSVLVFKKALSKDKLAFISETNAAILSQVRTTKDVLFASKDGKMVGVGGAFPFELMDSIFTELLK